TPKAEAKATAAAAAEIAVAKSPAWQALENSLPALYKSRGGTATVLSAKFTKLPAGATKATGENDVNYGDGAGKRADFKAEVKRGKVVRYDEKTTVTSGMRL